MSQSSALESKFAAALASAPDIPAPIPEFCFALTPVPHLGWSGGRRWRFDACWPQSMLAVEIEGIHGQKSRHRTVNGYHEDCCKYNVAAQLGWRILRYTSRHLASDEGCAAAVEQVAKILAHVAGAAATTTEENK